MTGVLPSVGSWRLDSRIDVGRTNDAGGLVELFTCCAPVGGMAYRLQLGNCLQFGQRHTRSKMPLQRSAESSRDFLSSHCDLAIFYRRQGTSVISRSHVR